MEGIPAEPAFRGNELEEALNIPTLAALQALPCMSEGVLPF